MVSIVSVKLNGKFVGDADYHKVTLVTSQAYQDGFTSLYALKMLTMENSLRIFKKQIQIHVDTRIKDVVIIYMKTRNL